MLERQGIQQLFTDLTHKVRNYIRLLLDKRLKIVGKITNSISYLFNMTKKEWAIDKNHSLMDRIIGFDIAEPADSPYTIGSTDMMDRVEEISEEKAFAIIGG